MTKNEMSVLIKAIMVAQLKADSFETDEPARAAPNPPATAEELRQFENHLRKRGLMLPPSLAIFLSLHNGIKDFAMQLSMRSIQEMLDESERDTAWKSVSPIYPFIFGTSDYTCSVAGFVPGTEDERGEMRVIVLGHRAADDPTEFENFEEFLEDSLWFYRGIIDAEKKD